MQIVEDLSFLNLHRIERNLSNDQNTPELKPYLISPPFGNWLPSRLCTRVFGSYTREPRSGLVRHTLRSLRQVDGGWINQIGLCNSGIAGLQFDSRHVYSFVGLDQDDWKFILRYLYFGPCPRFVEINLGCPNVHKYGIDFSTLAWYASLFTVIAKLPPTDAVDDIAAMCVEAGVSYLHCSNTIPTSRGGISGRQLKALNLPIVARLADRYPTIPVIAGGGIQEVADIDEYRALGAKHFSFSTVFLSPVKAVKLFSHLRRD